MAPDTGRRVGGNSGALGARSFPTLTSEPGGAGRRVCGGCYVRGDEHPPQIADPTLTSAIRHRAGLRMPIDRWTYGVALHLWVAASSHARFTLVG